MRAEVERLRADLQDARETAWRLLERCEVLVLEKDKEVADAIEQLTQSRPLDPWAALLARVSLDTTVLLASASAAGKDSEALVRITDAAAAYSRRAEDAKTESRRSADAEELKWEHAVHELRTSLDLPSADEEDLAQNDKAVAAAMARKEQEEAGDAPSEGPSSPQSAQP